MGFPATARTLVSHTRNIARRGVDVPRTASHDRADYLRATGWTEPEATDPPRWVHPDFPRFVFTTATAFVTEFVRRNAA
jgi:hypothetical protein